MQSDEFLPSPLIITLRLDEVAFNYFNKLRGRFFPLERNFLSAHLTLFHHLPDDAFVKEDLMQWSLQSSILSLHITELKMIGRGVAYKVDSPALVQLHSKMQKAWQHYLQPQDKQKLWPHVTIQNKVTPQHAKETFELLQPSFTPFEAKGMGFDLWEYQNGPWKFVEHFPFL